MTMHIIFYVNPPKFYVSLLAFNADTHVLYSGLLVIV